ncbi:hypothetical protein E2C01_036474 [Portunus trituberculatus]|uniref:Uncharacterized protein n=1 Tax=Portunus trituberculatus TaxID=210409 RepID=A0A5B7FE99_PORTR|nr:hypothetical protein [Portunus trituberculatus]
MVLVLKGLKRLKLRYIHSYQQLAYLKPLTTAPLQYAAVYRSM